MRTLRHPLNLLLSGMKRREFPLVRLFYQSEVHRAHPAELHMSIVIDLVQNVMLPKAPLPNALFSAVLMAGATMSRWEAVREPAFDCPPTCRKITIACWHGPDTVHAIRQHNPGIDMKRPRAPGQANGRAQVVDFVDQQSGSSGCQCDREKDRGA